MYKFGPELDQATIEWLQSGAELPETLSLQLRDGTTRSYNILDRDANGVVSALKKTRRGKKGFVLRVQDPQSNEIYAAKLCIPEDYKNSTPITELDFANALRDLDELMLRPKLLGTVARFSSEPRNNEGTKWICFLSDWLDGMTLRELIDAHPEAISPMLVTHVAKELITAVLVLEELGYKHDDLNLGNLMMVAPNARLAAINPDKSLRKLKIIDLGSMKHLDRATRKLDDDWSLTAKCLAELYNALHTNRSIASQYPWFMRDLREFIHRLADDPSRQFPDKGDYVRAIEHTERLITIEPRTKEFHPLEAISAEYLVDDEILLKIFVEHLSWLSIVQQPNPCVLVGPRGCGKSMVFRYMATRTHITSKDSKAEELRRSQAFCVYIGCSSDLGHDLVWLRRKGDAAAEYVEQITDYFNLVVARELMRALATAAAAKDFATTLGFAEQKKRRVADFLETAVGLDPRGVHLSGMEVFQSCADTLDRLRLKLAREMRTSPGPGIGTGATFLRDLCSKISEELPAFLAYRITFLLDDYTEHRLSRQVQGILNGIVFQRVQWMIFKVSSEPYGFNSATFYETRVDPTREYTPIDAGTKCLEMSSSERRKFVTDLLNRRLRAAKYDGTAETLIGDSEHKSDIKLAEAIRTKRKGKNTFYNGLDVLSNAWSGDVATVLHIVGSMFADANVTARSCQRISNEIQHGAIVRVSKGLRGRVQGYSPYGKEMNQVLSSFGDLAAQLLVAHKARVRSNRRSDINRKYRIEWTLPEGADVQTELLSMDASGTLYGLYKELIRRAVFHESLESRGKEGPSRRTIRLQMRSSLLPSFGTSLVHENHLKIDRTEDFVDFLWRTDQWAKAVLARYQTPNDLLGNLFYEDEGHEYD